MSACSQRVQTPRRANSAEFRWPELSCTDPACRCCRRPPIPPAGACAVAAAQASAIEWLPCPPRPPRRPEPLHYGVPVQLLADRGVHEHTRRALAAVGDGPAAGGNATSHASAAPLVSRAIQLPSSDAPAWAALGDIRDSWRADHERCVDAVRELNAHATVADLLLYGDSLTAGLAKNQEAWQESFAGLVALPLGMTGSTVEQLAWRLVEGGERPALPPRVAVFLIGVRLVFCLLCLAWSACLLVWGRLVHVWRPWCGCLGLRGGARLPCLPSSWAVPGSAPPLPSLYPSPPLLSSPAALPLPLTPQVNNVIREIDQLIDRLDWLLSWAQAAWPDAQVGQGGVGVWLREGRGQGSCGEGCRHATVPRSVIMQSQVRQSELGSPPTAPLAPRLWMARLGRELCASASHLRCRLRS